MRRPLVVFFALMLIVAFIYALIFIQQTNRMNDTAHAAGTQAVVEVCQTFAARGDPLPPRCDTE